MFLSSDENLLPKEFEGKLAAVRRGVRQTNILSGKVLMRNNGLKKSARNSCKNKVGPVGKCRNLH